MCNRLMDFLGREQLQSSSQTRCFPLTVFISVWTTDQSPKTDQAVENFSPQTLKERKERLELSCRPTKSRRPFSRWERFRSDFGIAQIVYMLFTHGPAPTLFILHLNIRQGALIYFQYQMILGIWPCVFTCSKHTCSHL